MKDIKEKVREIVRELHHCGFNQSVDCEGYESEVDQIDALYRNELVCPICLKNHCKHCKCDKCLEVK